MSREHQCKDECLPPRERPPALAGGGHDYEQGVGGRAIYA